MLKRNPASPHLSADYVWRVASGETIEIVEKKKGGEGVVSFVARNEAIVIKAKDHAPVIWSLQNRRCAEAAIISSDNENLHLHVLEMKSKLTQGEWSKAMSQLEGMFLSALAVARLLGVTAFATTTCYIAYVEDAMGPFDSADLIFMKTFVGTDNPVGGAEEWFSERMTLPFETLATVRKGQRDAQKNVSFGEI